MNKEIEEMASDMDYDCTKRDLYPDDTKEIANALYLLGYQKIDKDKQVVLTREEYERLKLELAIEKKRADESYTQKEVEEIIASKERIKSKEMAGEILEKIDKKSNGQTISITNLLRKQFGVEIKE